MPGTILQSFPRFSNGLLLFESFESANFTADQAWTLLNGTPTISSDVAVDGLHSLKLDLSYPQIQNQPGNFAWAAGWFYDDASIVAGGYEPWILWETDTAHVMGLGVQMATSTTEYTMNTDGVINSTGYTRTTGFHRFEFKHTLGGQFQLLIDNTVVASISGVGLGNPNTVKVGCNVYSGTPAFGYFDAIQVCQNVTLGVAHLTDGQVAKVYTAAGALVGQGVASGGIALVDTTLQDSAFDGYVTVTRPDGVSPYFWGPVLSLSTGDRWILDVYNFGRRPASLDIKAAATRQDKESNSGKNQSVFFIDRDIVSFTVTDMTEDEKNALMRWWSTAQRGEIFSCAIDEGGTYRSMLAEAITSVSASQFKPASLVGANRGSLLTLRTATGQYRDTKKVTGISGLYLQADSQFVSPFEVGDEIRDLLYWPAAIVTDKVLQVSLGNIKKRRWNVSVSFKEAL